MSLKNFINNKITERNIKIKEKLKSEIYETAFNNFDELESIMDEFFSHCFFEKYDIFNDSFSSSTVYIKYNKSFLDSNIECVLLIKTNELTLELINKFNEKFIDFIYKKYGKVNSLTATIIFYVENPSYYFYHFLNNGSIQQHKICYLYAGILPTEKKLYICKNKDGIYSSNYKKQKQQLFKILNIK